MKALWIVGRALLVALMMTVILGSGVLTLALTLRPLLPLDRLVLRLVVAHDSLALRVFWWP